MSRRFIFGVFIFIVGWVLDLIISVYTIPGKFSPNILLILVLAIGLLNGPLLAESMGFFWGLFADAFGFALFGSQAFLLTIVGYIAGRMSKHLNNEKVATQVVIVFVTSIFYSSGLILLQRIFDSVPRPVNLFHLALGIGINILISPVIFLFIRGWSGKWNTAQKRSPFGG